MGLKKKSNSRMAAIAALESNVQPIVELAYGDPIFSAVAHPSRNLIATGLATGHLYLHQYDHELLEAELAAKVTETKKKIKGKSAIALWANINGKEPGASGVDTVWKTKRHKGSCRSVAFDSSGETIYSVGTDKIVKAASAETGKVKLKTEPLFDLKSRNNFTTMTTAPNKPVILLGSEAGNVYVYDTRTLKEVHKVLNVHDDAVASVTNMSGKSDYQYLSVGSTTLTHFDIRKGILQQSENQEDEILSVSFVDPSICRTACAGMGGGVVTLWRQDKNDFVDQISRVRVGDDSVDSVISGLDESGDLIWSGSADGYISKIDTRRGKVLEKRLHHTEDEVAGLDLDFDYRLVSYGMESLKIWSNKDDDEDDEEDDSSSEADSDWSGISEENESNAGSESDSDEESDGEADAEPSVTGKRRSKDEPDSESETPEPKPAPKKQKKPKLTGKQLKNLQQHEHGIRKFEGL